MKKYTLIIILTLIIHLSYSQIKFSGYFETGLLKEAYSLNKFTYIGSSNGLDLIEEGKKVIIINGVRNISEVTRLENYKCMYSELKIGISWKWFTLKQSLYDIFTYDGSGFTFKPLEIFYTTRLHWEWRCIRIGYEHMCSHPLINYHNWTESVTRRGSHDKLYLRLTFNSI